LFAEDRPFDNYQSMSIEQTLEDQIVGLRHVGHVVEDIEKALQHFRKLYGVDTPDGVATFGGLKLVYLDPGDTGGLLVELIES
jgi:hypothetical protein